MLFLFTVTEWGHIIYSEETEANTPLQKTADGKRAKIIGFPSSRTLHFLIFMLHNIPQSASTPLDNLHSRTCCRLNYKVVNWGDRHQWFIYTFYSRCILTLIRSFCVIWEHEEYERGLYKMVKVRYFNEIVWHKSYIMFKIMLYVQIKNRRQQHFEAKCDKKISNSCSTICPCFNLWLQLVQIMTSAWIKTWKKRAN